MVKVSELTGALLDYWVARAENEINPRFEYGYLVIGGGTVYAPTTEWSQGGPLIEKYAENFGGGRDDWWASVMDTVGNQVIDVGNTPLQAICRAVVRAAFGDEVEEVAS